MTYQLLYNTLMPDAASGSFKALGYTISSNTPMAELLPMPNTQGEHSEERQIRIVYGQSSLEERIIQGTSVAPVKRFSFSEPSAARYTVMDGSEVLVEPFEGSDPQLIHEHLMGTAFGMLMYQRGDVALRGAAVVLDAASSAPRGLVICGEQGVGKSTFSAYLRHCGYPWLGDDLIALHPESVNGEMQAAAPTEALYLHHGYPLQRLHRDAFALLAPVMDDAEAPGETARVKLQYKSWKGFWTDPVQLSVMVVIDIKPEASSISLRELHGEEKLQTIFNQVYCQRLVRSHPLTAHYWRRIESVAEQAKVFVLMRPAHGDHLDAMRRVIEGL